jgi:hypothetical protein
MKNAIGAAARVINPTTTNAALKSEFSGAGWCDIARAISSASAPTETPTVAASCCPAV